MQNLATFLRKDDGAVTVDWVVLCALVVALTVLITTMMSEGATGLASGTTAHMSGMLK
ncbi:hypothetical protein [Pseudooceanicola sp.]|jgi:hypothetical protein|uniref:hypothetical protein n=1 Tax=Pseudooceanicola sp. TaxID=1914328 RepID=UPI00405951A0